MESSKSNILALKHYAALFLALIGAIISSIFWVQNYGESHYYPRSLGENIEEEHHEIKADIEKIRDQNIEMLLMLGRIEGALSND